MAYYLYISGYYSLELDTPVVTDMKKEESPHLHARVLKKFLQQQQLPYNNPWILAISGGVDSMVLLDAFILLLENGDAKLPSSLIVGHVDHGWRESSAQESAQLAQYVEEKSKSYPALRIVCHCLRNPCSQGQNIEAFARHERYQFFGTLAKKYGACNVFLAHHQGDRRETIFKNLLEGKELALIHGLRTINLVSDLQLLRPWLGLEKQDLLKVAQDRSLSYVEDATNRDERFLRARMRQTIFPMLDVTFPKSWQKGLDQIGCYSEELWHDLQKSLQGTTITPIPGLGGWYWPLPTLKHPLEWRLFLRMASHNIEPLGREGAARLLQAIEQKKWHTKFKSRRFMWIVRSHCLLALDTLQDFVCSTDLGWNSPLKIEGKKPVFFWGPWKIERCCYEEGDISKLPHALQDSLCRGLFYTPHDVNSCVWTHIKQLTEPSQNTSLRHQIFHHMQRKRIPQHARAWMPLNYANPCELKFTHGMNLRSAHWLRWTWHRS